LPYICLVLFASTFHRTAIIALPLFWLASDKLKWTRILFIIIATVITITSLSLFVDLASRYVSEVYWKYAEVGEGGGEVWVSFFVGQGILLYWLGSKIPDPDGRYARIMNIYLIGLVPSLASTLSSVDPSGILRLHLYFSPMSILLWPMIFQRLKNLAMRRVLYASFIIVTLAFFILTTITFSHLVPYRLNPILWP
jgi:hypothetical protein